VAGWKIQNHAAMVAIHTTHAALTRSGMTSLLKMTVVVLMLVIFACIGIAHIINPDWFIKRSGVRKGGELLTDWNRLQFQIVAAIFGAFALYLLYRLFRA
jgi:hypothetical protein